jgi:hypothetical protein
MIDVREVEELLEENDIYWNSLGWKTPPAYLKVTTELPFEVVDSRLGEEGDWSVETYIVVKIGDRYFKKTGHYASHDGEYWDGPVTEVKKVTKTVEVYE